MSIGYIVYIRDNKGEWQSVTIHTTKDSAINYAEHYLDNKATEGIHGWIYEMHEIEVYDDDDLSDC